MYQIILEHYVVSLLGCNLQRGSWSVLNENETYLSGQETNSRGIEAKLAPVNGNFMEFDELFYTALAHNYPRLSLDAVKPRMSPFWSNYSRNVNRLPSLSLNQNMQI